MRLCSRDKVAQVACCIRELLDQFLVTPGQCRVILYPYIANGAARGCVLQNYVSRHFLLNCFS